ncbi:hypothetical protein LCGC14_1536710 [marine sediment metagenome]|uniref:Heme exporter protein D n=2 Tax=root TaxID=1 RepID=A0A831VWD8_9GAMM|nr:heme exporter protein CcmD [Marinobacter antarcticus]HEA53998.1 heme exporter protein CcmD [Marinobacter antarcticus]
MAFDSFSAFMAMEGHGPYVWSCYAMFFVLMMVMMVWSVRSRKAAIESCRRGYEFQAGKLHGDSIESSSEKSKVAYSAPSAAFERVDVSQD